MRKVSMRTLHLATVAFVCSLLLTGCKPKSTSSAQLQDEKKPSVSQETLKTWMDAANLGSGLECSVEDVESKSAATYAVKGKKIRVKGFTLADDNSQTNVGEMIIDGSTIYSWDEQTKQGIKSSLRSDEDLESLAPNTPNFTNEDSVKAFNEKGYKLDCTPTAVDDSQFTPPADVQFQDFEAMIEESMQKTKEEMPPEQRQKIEEMMNEEH
jgi:hypothetical protein